MTMGLLDKVTRLIRSGNLETGAKTSSVAVAGEEKPSLLKKSMALRAKGLLEKAMDFGGRKEKPTSAYDDPTSFEPATASSSSEDDFSFDSPSADFGDIDFGAEPSGESFGGEGPDAEVSFPDSAFGEESFEEETANSDFDLSSVDLGPSGEEGSDFEIDPDLGLGLENSDIGADFGELPEEVPSKGLLSKAEEAKEEEKIPSGLPKPEAIKDPFDDWVKDAENQASQEASRPFSKEQNKTENAQFLFDDDSDYSTMPIDLQIASRKKLENYLSAFEISKEISASKDFTNFFENLSFSIQGQIGAESIVIFSSTNGEFDVLRVVEAQGIGADPDWVLEVGDESYQAALKTPSVVYAREILKHSPPKKEKEILEKTEAEMLVPIRSYDEFYGIIILSKTIEGEDYTIEDLEFLKIVGEMAGSASSPGG